MLSGQWNSLVTRRPIAKCTSTNVYVPLCFYSSPKYWVVCVTWQWEKSSKIEIIAHLFCKQTWSRSADWVWFESAHIFNLVKMIRLYLIFLTIEPVDNIYFLFPRRRASRLFQSVPPCNGLEEWPASGELCSCWVARRGGFHLLLSSLSKHADWQALFSMKSYSRHFSSWF